MMRKTMKRFAAVLLLFLYGNENITAEEATSLDDIKAQLAILKEMYENRIAELEAKVKSIESPADKKTVAASKSQQLPTTARAVKRFNPAMSVVLNGKATSFSSPESEFAGFSVSHEGERTREGLGLGESEISVSANIDNKFYGSLTAAIVREEGEDKVELEEAYLQTLPDLGIMDGLSVKAGKAFWTLGYINEQHAHTDDFADRPLPYRAFLNKSYNDDGLEISYVLPMDFYTEIGGGVFRGDDFPFGNSDGEGIGAWSAFARIGSDIGDNQSWRLGGYALIGEAKGGRTGNEDTVTFIGDSNLYALDFRYTYSPTANAREKEWIIQGESFWRAEDGTYEDTNAGSGAVRHDDTSVGWYAQTVYKFHPTWRVGFRYSELESPDILADLNGSALDGRNHDPRSYSAMIDWTNSEFSRVRFQWNNNKLSNATTDNQFMIQYIMSVGAHGAHKY